MRLSLLGYLTGAICLALGLVSFAVVLPAAASAAMNPGLIPRSIFVGQLASGLIFVAVAGRLWWGSIKRAEGEDILSGQRGLLVGLMVVTAALLAGALLWLMSYPEAWAGAIHGTLEALRDIRRARQ
jgi:hypothetical protein